MAVLLVSAGAVLGGLAPAHAAVPTLQLREAGAVQARGAGIVVEFVITCSAGEQVSVVAVATQRQADGSLLRGRGTREVLCTGTTQVARLAVLPVLLGRGTSNAPFRPGVAFVTVETGYCDPAGCGSVQSSRTVQVPALVMNAARVTGTDFVAALPSSARLQAEGAGVLIRMPYRCTTGFNGSLHAMLVQRTSADEVTSSSALTSVTCTSLNRAGVLSFHAVSAAWRTGTALVTLVDSSFICNSTHEVCRHPYAHRTITLI